MKKDSLPDRKGIHPMDEIVGIDGFDCVGGQVRGCMEAIFSETRKVMLRLRHHR